MSEAPKKREKYERLVAAVQDLPPALTAVAHPCDAASLAGALDAARLGIITPIFVGPRDRILAAAAEADLDISAYEIVDAPFSHAAAETAVALVRAGRAELLMKGSLHTDELMAAVVKRIARAQGPLSEQRAERLCEIAEVLALPVISDAESEEHPIAATAPPTKTRTPSRTAARPAAKRTSPAKTARPSSKRSAP